jgi:uncharacterized protein
MKENKLYFKILLALLLPFTSSLVIFTHVNKLAFSNTSRRSSLLWEISGNGLTHPSYLLGTIHSHCSRNLFLTKQQQKAIDNVKQIYLEIDDHEFDKSESEDDFIPDRRVLMDILTKDEYKKLISFFETHGHSLDNNDNRLRPIILALERVNSHQFTKNAYMEYCKVTNIDGVAGKEDFIIDAARTKLVKIQGIETKQDRAKIESKISLREQINFLMEQIDRRLQATPSDLQRQIQEIGSLYNNQDIEKIEKYIDNHFSSLEKKVWIDALGNQRNTLWIPRMRQAMAKKTTLFGFGFFHLAGKGGLVSQLRSEGYILRPVFD